MPPEVDVRALELAAASAETLVAAAADTAAPLRERLAALVALAIRAAGGAISATDAICDLLDDAPLVDAAVAAGLAGAVSGLALLDGVPVAQRRYLATIAAAAGASGVHLAALAIAAGDPALAARAAAPELRAATGDTAAILGRALQGIGSEEFWTALGEALGADRERVAAALKLAIPGS